MHHSPTHRSLISATSRLTVVVGLAAGSLFMVSAPADARSGAEASAVHAAPCKKGSGLNLRGKDFTDGSELPDLRCADLTGAKLDEVDFTQKDLTGANLRNASMKEANLTQATLDYADLRGADLTSADLGQMDAKQADLRGAVLVDAEATQAEFAHADLTGATLTRADLGQVTFTNAKLVGADLNDAELGGIKGRTADFTRAKLHEAKFTQAQLQHAVFVDADLSEAEFTQADMQGADLRGANVDKARFIQADDVNLTGARGEPKDVPDDAIVGELADVDDSDSSGDSLPVIGRSSGPPFSLILVVLSAVGLILTLLIWSASHRRRSRLATAFATARKSAEEDVTRFGEEIDALDFDMKIDQLSGPSREWRVALDAYESAKQTLAHARNLHELQPVALAVRHGRSALQDVRAHLT